MKKLFCTLGLVLLLAPAMIYTAKGNVSVPAIFGDHMVLQQNQEIIIWGWARPNEEVTVQPGWEHEEVKTKGNNKAQWQVKIKTPGAGGPFTLTIKGYNTLVIEDVLIGEVWLCSGQSNMEWTAAQGIDDAEAEVATARHPEIRFFTAGLRTAVSPQLDIEGEWVVCTPETMKYFSAVGYFFGREIQSKLDAPVGLISSSWGGTPAEVWTSADVVEDNDLFREEAQKIREVPWCPREPGVAFNAMIAPLIPFRIAGVLWYQGETNTYSPGTYEQFFPALIENWRQHWGYDFPFYYVQIAPYKYGRPMEGAWLRDSQRKALEVPNTGMVVVSDIGNTEDIHPRNKKDVGLRLASWALANTYGKEGITYSGPLYKNMEQEGKKIRVFFDHAENGLMAKGKEITHFEVAGEDGVFVPAKAKIDGGTVVVQAREVKEPVAVRFAWGNTAEPNLFNKEGLPASTFRTDDWEIVLK